MDRSGYSSPKTMAEQLPRCLLCGNPTALVGFMTPNRAWRKTYGVKSGEAIAYGVCEKHGTGAAEFIEAIERRLADDMRSQPHGS